MAGSLLTVTRSTTFGKADAPTVSSRLVVGTSSTEWRSLPRPKLSEAHAGRPGRAAAESLASRMRRDPRREKRVNSMNIYIANTIINVTQYLPATGTGMATGTAYWSAAREVLLIVGIRKRGCASRRQVDSWHLPSCACSNIYICVRRTPLPAPAPLRRVDSALMSTLQSLPHPIHPSSHPTPAVHHPMHASCWAGWHVEAEDKMAHTSLRESSVTALLSSLPRRPA